ncbi:outer dense fiber protein 2-like isoform X2 [Gadus chalcogrammus]|uniref:outer dense fiber protein 2-like isoform X2 n=1 Tax=Gadus chalcogrammus TaxID=1042646 RepID=UPI0024C49C56|nr:outer dense fiber protein 2-like isoform X2 [Gadus chalcogrammus]
MSADNRTESTLGFSSTRDDLTLCYGDLEASKESERKLPKHSSPYRRTPVDDNYCIFSRVDFAERDQSQLMKTLLEAEAAANNAAVQLVSFKDTMDDEFEESHLSVTDTRQVSRQRGLLLEKLEDFKRINRSVRQKLKRLQEAEADRLATDKQIDILLNKITQAESDNVNLKRDLNNTENQLGELMSLRRKEQESTETALQAGRTVETTRARLQGQLHLKEAENNRLTAQLRALERTLTEQKMQMEDLKAAITAQSVKMAQDKEALIKATHAQKQRAKRFEAAVDKCYAQLKEKEIQLARALSERDSWRLQQEQQSEDQHGLVSQIELLKCHTTDLTARLQRERDELTTANLTAMERVERLSVENRALNSDNARIKESISVCEQQLAQCEAAQTEQSLLSEERQHQTQRHQSQVAALQTEVDDLRIKYQSLVRETEGERGRKDEEVEKLDSQSERLKTSGDMRNSIQEANTLLEEQITSLEKEMEVQHQENVGLVRRLAGQDEALSYGSRQLDQRSAECHALSTQLEAAMSHVSQQVSHVKGKAVSREDALQTKIKELEAEKGRRDSELKLLRQSMLSTENKFEVRLKDLQRSLDQSESHKQSIQSYVDFLKNSYATMFDEGVQLSSYHSYFLK